MILGLSEPQTYSFNKYFPEIYSVSGPVSGPINKPVNKKLWTVQSREQGEIHNKEILWMETVINTLGKIQQDIRI